MNKTLSTVVIGLLALGAVYVWQTGLFSSNKQADNTSVSTTDTDSQADPASPVNEAQPTQESASNESASSESETEQAESSVEVADDNGTTVSQSSPSPFAVIEDDTESNEPLNAQSTAEESASAQESPEVAVQVRSSESTGGSIVVPESYPVTDAAKYFIPKEERGPGNLGGPPPLNFPGGPSDPNLAPSPPVPGE